MKLETDREAVAARVHTMLAEHGRRLWNEDIVLRDDAVLSLDCYVINGGLVVLSRTRDGRTISGWEVFTPIVASARSDLTVEAVQRLLDNQPSETVAALLAARDLCREALPKFNWGASALDANAIKLLNEVPSQIENALRAEGY